VVAARQFSDHWKNVLMGGWTFSGHHHDSKRNAITFITCGCRRQWDYAPEHAFLTGQRIAMITRIAAPW